MYTIEFPGVLKHLEKEKKEKKKKKPTTSFAGTGSGWVFHELFTAKYSSDAC